MYSSFIAGVLLFTNTLQIIGTNASSSLSLTTNQDTIYSTSSVAVASLVLSLDYPVKDASNNYVGAVTTSGTYSYISPDGWGHQRYLTNSSVKTNFFGYLPSSLAGNLVTNLLARTNLGTASEQMFAIKNYATTNFSRNPAFWLRVAPQLTAIVIGVGTPFSGSIGGAAISPRHVINCAHAAFGVGQRLLFIDDAGLAVTRTVLANTNNGDGSGRYPDVNIALLNSDLPASVHPFKVLPVFGTVLNYLPTMTNSPRLAVVGMNQDQLVFPKLVSTAWLGSSSNSVYAFSSSQWLDAGWSVNIRGGDSGHPIMALIDTNLVLLSHWTFASSGYNYCSFEPVINSMMHWLSTNNVTGTDYQLTTSSLTAYPAY